MKYLLFSLLFVVIFGCRLEEIPDESLAGEVSSFDCQGVQITDLVRPNKSVIDVNLIVPFTGGNGGVYPGQVVVSTGVAGLTATLLADTLSTGSGSLTYHLSGTALQEGSALFSVQLGDQKCIVSVPVTVLAGSVETIECDSIVVNGTILAGVDAGGLTVTVPYKGGNGGACLGQILHSEGVLGLTATSTSGLLSKGDSIVTFTLSGLPEETGMAKFALEWAGQECVLQIPVIELNGLIDSLNCASVRVNDFISSGVPVNSLKVSVPYYGGNGGVFTGQVVNSSQVAGLAARLTDGRFSVGEGNLTYTLSGTAGSSGTASFVISAGGRGCEFTMPVLSLAGSISALKCAESQTSGSVIAGVSSNGITVTVPYTGGNGGEYFNQTVNSSGVAGLKLTNAGGTLSNGDGTLVYALSGIPQGAGTAIFQINAGGQSCHINIEVMNLQGSVSTLNCTESQLSGQLTANTAANGVAVSVPYTGGNGGVYSGGSVTSTGVTGLTATLSPGTLTNGDGNLVYNITGVPSGSGTALFSITVGGKSCMISTTVSNLQGVVGSLECWQLQFNGQLTSWLPAGGLPFSVPYTGGNGGVFTGETIFSTGVTGLAATLAGGAFSIGNGNLVYVLSGTPQSAGTATFQLNAGGQSCSISFDVEPLTCGAFVAPGVWKEFRCYNEGVLNELADPFTPSYEINGGYWQWGRKNMAAPGPSSNMANAGSIMGWNTSYAPNGSWVDSVKTSNDPCPTGYEVPSISLWEDVVDNNQGLSIGTWFNDASNYSAGYLLGNKLMLPAAGDRKGSNGSLSNRGVNGEYWSSSGSSSGTAFVLIFNSISPYTFNYGCNLGLSVRCVAE